MTVQTPARRRGLAHPVAAGAFKPVIIAVLVAAALAGAGVTPRAADASKYPSTFARSDDVARRGEAPGKDALHRLQIVANLRDQRPQTPLVVLLGGSSARESTVDDESWAAQIEQSGGPPTTVYNLGCRHDTFAQDLEIARLLPADAPTMVYIGVNLGRFANAPASPEITLPEPVIPPPHYFPHIYSVSKYVQPWSTKAYYVSYWMKLRWPQFEERYGYNLDTLEELVEACLRRGLHPVLLDLPRDLAVIGHTLDGPVAEVKAGCAMLAQAYGVPWVTPVKACGLVDGDFFDLWHLVEPGRAKYQARLSLKTVSLLHRYGMDEPSTPAPTPTATATPAPSPTAAPAAD
jgi:hypothetical protein